jgi:hypothetical protein
VLNYLINMLLNNNLRERSYISSINNISNVNNNNVNMNNITNNINVVGEMKRKKIKPGNISFEKMIMYIEYVKDYIKSDVRLRLYDFFKKFIIHKYVSRFSICLLNSDEYITMDMIYNKIFTEILDFITNIYYINIPCKFRKKHIIFKYKLNNNMFFLLIKNKKKFSRILLSKELLLRFLSNYMTLEIIENSIEIKNNIY